MLDSLYVRNFRLFDEFKIERLGKVNLIVGLNNSGKTCLLEALYLYAANAATSALYQMIEARGEDWEFRHIDPDELPQSESHPFRSFFPNYRFPDALGQILEVGSLVNARDRVSLGLTPSQPDLFGNWEETRAELILKRQKGKNILGTIDIDREIRRKAKGFISSAKNGSPAHVQFVPSRPPPLWEVYQLWDRVNLNPSFREQAFEALRIVDKDLLEVVMIGQGRRLTPIVLYRNSDLKVPLASLGDGMNHLFLMVLSLVNAAGGMLLIDEFENGLHYSVQFQIWQLVFKMARELDIQVFASTHGWDCIEAFQQAAGESGGEAMLFRLGRSRRKSTLGNISAKTYSQEDLMLATKSNLDIR